MDAEAFRPGRICNLSEPFIAHFYGCSMLCLLQTRLLILVGFLHPFRVLH